MCLLLGTLTLGSILATFLFRVFPFLSDRYASRACFEPFQQDSPFLLSLALALLKQLLHLGVFNDSEAFTTTKELNLCLPNCEFQVGFRSDVSLVVSGFFSSHFCGSFTLRILVISVALIYRRNFQITFLLGKKGNIFSKLPSEWAEGNIFFFGNFLNYLLVVRKVIFYFPEFPKLPVDFPEGNNFFSGNFRNYLWTSCSRISKLPVCP